MRPWAPEMCWSRLRALLGSSWTGRERARPGAWAPWAAVLRASQGGTELGDSEVPALAGRGQDSGLC